MKGLLFSTLFFQHLCLASAWAQPVRELPPIFVDYPKQIDQGWGESFRSPESLQLSICEKIAKLRWRSYSKQPSSKPCTVFIPQFQYGVVRRTEQSSNGWSAQPIQLFPEFSRFFAQHTQTAYDVRTKALYAMKLTGILCDTGDGEEKFARGAGLMKGASDHLLFEGGSTSSSIPGGSHGSSSSASTSDTTWITEDQLIQGAVEPMIQELQLDLARGGYSISLIRAEASRSIPQLDQSPLISPPGQAVGGPPEFGSRPVASSWLYRKLLTPSEISRYKRCKRLIIWEKQSGRWQQLETVAGSQIKFTSKLVEIQRATSEQPTEYLQFEL